MKVLVVVSAVLAVAAAQYLGNPHNCLNGLCAAPYAAAYAAPYAAPYAGAYAAPYAKPYAAAYAKPYAAAYATPYAAAYAKPYAMPYAAAAPALASSQFQIQDGLGAYKYGYSSPLSAKTEAKNAFGGTTGSYSYIDANGIKQTVNYVADAAGFRAQATNLPVAPVAVLAAPVMTAVGPAPVGDTADVRAAKAEFRRLYAEAAQAAAAAPEERRRRSLQAPLAPADTPAVRAAKALHAALYNAEVLRASGVPVPTPVLADTPAVQLEKARHAALYNQAAVRAAAAPDYGAGFYGLGLRSAAWGAPGLIL